MNKKIRKPELLAPAGDMERLEAAVRYGADAVYLGGTVFGMRAGPANFTDSELHEAVKYAHSLNKKVYVTVNIVFHDKDLTGVEEYLVNLDKIGVDAIIVSDPTVIKEDTPDTFMLELDQDAQMILPYAIANDILKVDPSADYSAFLSERGFKGSSRRKEA